MVDSMIYDEHEKETIALSDQGLTDGLGKRSIKRLRWLVEEWLGNVAVVSVDARWPTHPSGLANSSNFRTCL